MSLPLLLALASLPTPKRQKSTVSQKQKQPVDVALALSKLPDKARSSAFLVPPDPCMLSFLVLPFYHWICNHWLTTEELPTVKVHF